jgi:hypothetical protein
MLPVVLIMAIAADRFSAGCGSYHKVNKSFIFQMDNLTVLDIQASATL